MKKIIQIELYPHYAWDNWSKKKVLLIILLLPLGMAGFALAAAIIIPWLASL